MGIAIVGSGHRGDHFIQGLQRIKIIRMKINVSHKTMKIIGAVMLLGGIAWLVHVFMKGKLVTSKSEAIAYLKKIQPSRDENTLNTFGDTYLIYWANAIKQSQPVFLLDGKSYSSATGRSITITENKK